MKRSLVLIAALGALLVLAPPAAQARGGALDPGFGTDGRVVDSFFNGVAAMALAPDGKIAMTGWCCYTRDGPSPDVRVGAYKSDGSAAFDDEFSYDIVPSPSYGTAVAWQQDGKLLAAGFAGYSGHTGFLARLNADGSLDPSFGNAGITMSGLTDTEPKALIIQPDGKVVVVGTANAFGPSDENPSAPPKFLLARFNPDGSVDPTFGTNGIVTTSFGGSDFVNAAVQQAGGRIVVGGFTGFVDEGGGSYDASILAGYSADGARDPGFGFVGEPASYYRSSIIKSLLVQPDGKILVGEVDLTMNQGELGRFNADGTPDYSFHGYPAPMEALALEPDGKIVAAGGAIARYDSDGFPDLTFGRFSATAPASSVTVPGFSAATVAVRPDGEIVSAGLTNRGGEVVRLLPDRSQVLKVERRGRARGTILSSPAGIFCPRGRAHAIFPRRCSQLFEQGSTVTLVLKNAQGSSVTWGGACHGRGPSCTVPMSGDRTVVVKFTRKQR